MKIVSVESPFAPKIGWDGALWDNPDFQANMSYAKAAMADSLRRGEAPLASHLLYPQVLNDMDPKERRLGLDASHEWRKRCDIIAVYSDRGISSGMLEAIKLAEVHGIALEYRSIL